MDPRLRRDIHAELVEAAWVLVLVVGICGVWALIVALA